MADRQFPCAAHQLRHTLNGAVQWPQTIEPAAVQKVDAIQASQNNCEACAQCQQLCASGMQPARRSRTHQREQTVVPLGPDKHRGNEQHRKYGYDIREFKIQRGHDAFLRIILNGRTAHIPERFICDTDVFHVVSAFALRENRDRGKLPGFLFDGCQKFFVSVYLLKFQNDGIQKTVFLCQRFPVLQEPACFINIIILFKIIGVGFAETFVFLTVVVCFCAQDVIDMA